MKKDGKKYRRLQKEKAERRIEAEKRASAPYSKHKVKLCIHYGAIGGGIIPGYAQSYLYPISDTECRCAECQKVFPIEVYHEMKDFAEGYSRLNCTTMMPEMIKIAKSAKPVKYYYVAEDTIEYLPDDDEDDIIVPRVTSIY
jgi:hypothetical protein